MHDVAAPPDATQTTDRGFTLSQRARNQFVSLAALLLVAGALSACSDDSSRLDPVTAPTGRAAAFSRGGSLDARDTVSCEIAKLMPDGSYRDKAAKFLVSGDLTSPTGERANVALHDSPKKGADPTRVVACQLPNTVAAMAWLAATFHEASDSVSNFGKASATVDYAPAAALPGARPRLPSGDSTAHSLDCITLDGCSDCPETAISCDPGTGEWEGPAPSDPDQPQFSISGTDASLGPIVCSGGTDYPHLSGTPGFFGNVNVHGWTQCPVPLNISVTVDLARQRCILFFCWWSGVNEGFNSRLGTYTDANAAGACKKGYWRGTSTHTAFFPSGQIGGSQTRQTQFIFCPF